MPDLEGALPLILLMIFLWVRSIGAAMKKNRQRQEQALGEGPEADPTGGEDGPLELPGLPNLPPDAGVATTAPAKRPGLREQLRDMGRQLEQQMQQAAEQGRPGSMVGHVDPEEAPEPPPFIRRPAPSPQSQVTPASVPALSVRSSPRREPLRPAAARPLGEPRPPGVASRRAFAAGDGPLERLERYPSLARAVILSEILGRPPGLSDDREA
ncbi:hypothetical protein [Candidatus Palauibacter sp.]|uniref:hypothetical protein n=1 Tax=Candidatus Palauibacter sp. TaxID=3101350 RepID=UPI003B02D33E